MTGLEPGDLKMASLSEGNPAMGTMQTAALPTQAVGTAGGAAFQRQSFSNTATMATQNMSDMQPGACSDTILGLSRFKTVAPDVPSLADSLSVESFFEVMKTQPGGTYANTYVACSACLLDSKWLSGCDGYSSTSYSNT